MDETAVHCRVELFSDLDSVNNYLCFSDIFVVASEILSKQKISAVCPVSTRKPRTESSYLETLSTATIWESLLAMFLGALW